LFEFTRDVGKHDLHLSSSGAAARIDKHADAHAAHECHFLHVDDQPLESTKICKGVFEGGRDDLGLTLADGRRVNRSYERIGIWRETNEQACTGVVDGSPPPR
jgi:hypothetical protein